MMNNSIFLILLIVLTTSLTSCTRLRDTGNLVSKSQIEALESGVVSRSMTKAAVLELLGAPSIVSDDETSWFYIHRTLVKKSILQPQVKAQLVIRLTFENDALVAVAKTDNDYTSFTPVQDMTRVDMKEGYTNKYLRYFTSRQGVKHKKTRR